MIKLLKTLFASVLVCWIPIFLVTFFTAPDLRFGARLGYTFIAGAIIGALIAVGLCKNPLLEALNLNSVPSKKEISDTDSISRNSKGNDVLYIYEGEFGTKFMYRVEGTKIYKGLEQVFAYRIEGNKIYKGLEQVFSYRIEGNKIYRGLEVTPLYEIKGNRIYIPFRTSPKYRIESKLGRSSKNF